MADWRFTNGGFLGTPLESAQVVYCPPTPKILPPTQIPIENPDIFLIPDDAVDWWKLGF